MVEYMTSSQKVGGEMMDRRIKGSQRPSEVLLRILLHRPEPEHYRSAIITFRIREPFRIPLPVLPSFPRNFLQSLGKPSPLTQLASARRSTGRTVSAQLASAAQLGPQAQLPPERA